MTTLFLKLYPGDAIVLLTINVLVQIAVVVVLAWAISLIVSWHRPAMRHGIWLAALGCVFVSPIAAYIATQADLSLVTFRLLPQWAENRTSPLWAEGPTFAQPSLLHTSSYAIRPVGSFDNSPAIHRWGRNEKKGLFVPEGRLNRAVGAAESIVPKVETNVAEPSLDGDVHWSTWSSLIAAFWAAGVLYLLVRLLYGWWNVLHLHRRLKFLDEESLSDVLPEVRRALNVKTLPTLATCPGDALSGPITMGVFWPVVILPENLTQTLDHRGLRDVLIHEFAHAVRRDPLVGFLQRLAAIIYWPYPPVHFLNRQLAAAREEVCDNYVLRQGDWQPAPQHPPLWFFARKQSTFPLIRIHGELPY